MNIITMPATQPFTTRPRLRFTRANAKGTGSSVVFELHPAHDSTQGSMFLSLAVQKTVASRSSSGMSVFPTFDWANKICVKLEFCELSQLLMVFHGLQESLCDGKGLFHRSATANTIIKFSHIIEPRSGYALDISRKPENGNIQHGYFFFSPEEAYGLAIAIENSMSVIAFGVPMVMPHTQHTPIPEVVPGPVAIGDPF